MIAGQPSRTALGAAAHRAAHQSLDQGRIFPDPLAAPVLGVSPQEVFGTALDQPANRSMRLFIAARSRFAEEGLAAAARRGVRQYVVLGAGLDTFAHRNPFADVGLRVFEVDHPATQAWKRARLAAAGITSPPSLTFAPVDFERETLAEGLAAAGLDADAPAFFSWLGVVVYLTREAVIDALAYIAQRPVGTEVALTYGEPVSAYPAAEQPRHQARLDRMAAMGEPWITRFAPDEIAAELQALGLQVLEDLGPAETAPRFFGRPGRAGPGSHLLRAGRLVPGA